MWWCSFDADVLGLCPKTNSFTHCVDLRVAWTESPRKLKSSKQEKVSVCLRLLFYYSNILKLKSSHSADLYVLVTENSLRSGAASTERRSWVDFRAYLCNFCDDVKLDEPIEITYAVTSDPLLYVNKHLRCLMYNKISLFRMFTL